MEKNENVKSTQTEDASPTYPEDKASNPLEYVATHEEDIGEQKISGRTMLAIFALAISYEAALFSYILPANIILTINADVGPVADFYWIAVSWTLASAVCQAITGRLSDIFGRRYLVLAGDAFGLIGCAVAGTAQSINQVIAGMGLMGVGLSGQALCYACMNELVPKRKRGIVLGIFNSTAVPSSIFGAAIAYAMVKTLSWRWTFYIGIILNGLGLILVAFAYHPPQFDAMHIDQRTKLHQFKRLDFVGLAFFAVGLTLFLVSISWGGVSYPWNDPHVLSTIIIGSFLLFVCFPIWEYRLCPKEVDRLIPRMLFRGATRTIVLPMFTVFVSSMLYYSMAILWPQQIQLLYTTDPTKIGWYAAALGASSTIGAIIGSIFFSKLKHTRIQFTTAILVQSCFIAAMSATGIATAVRAIVFVCFVGFAIGYTQNQGILLIQLGAPDSQIGAITGLLGTVRSFGGAIGTTIYSTILAHYVKSHYATDVGESAMLAGLPSSDLLALFQALAVGTPAALEAVPDISPDILAAVSAAVKNVYTLGFRRGYLVSIAFGVLAVCAAASIKSADHLMTNKVVATLDKPHLLGKGDGTAVVLRTKDEVEASEMAEK